VPAPDSQPGSQLDNQAPSQAGNLPGSQPAIQPIVSDLRSLIAADMAVESVEVPRDAEKEGVLVVRGRLLRPSHEVFPRWLTTINELGYTPTLRPALTDSPEDVVVRVHEGVARKGKSRAWINAVLFVLTLISTLFAGALYTSAVTQVQSPWEFISPGFLLNGLPFAATLLGILAAHEFGHYFAARYHKVAVTLPYFIPMPLTFGTLGAFIQLKEPVPDRRKLFDIGVAGPLAGLVLAVPLLFVGLYTSVMDQLPVGGGYMMEGNSIFYLTAKFIVFGQWLPNFATGEDVMMNQVCYAAWIGLLVTALNLLPVGQLDGGHTVFAMFGEKARYINRITVGMLAFFALASLPFVQQYVPALSNVAFSGWFLWLFLILFLIGVQHPPALDDVTRLDRRRWWIGVLVIIIFILIFVPVPMREM
jgi:membrane-associated protease RseP (regulator of RpoE activity)